MVAADKPCLTTLPMLPDGGIRRKKKEYLAVSSFYFSYFAVNIILSPPTFRLISSHFHVFAVWYSRLGDEA